jgi:predicted nucleic acid-binding protein
LSIDLAALLRSGKPEKRRGQLTQRPIDQLIAAASVASNARMAVVPDTNVYIRNMSGTLPAAVEVLLDNALQWHCSVCIAEITAGIAHYDPGARDPGAHDPGAHDWRHVRRQYGILLGSIPDTRLLVPDGETWHLAGIISGTLSRTQGYQPHQRKECLNDALIYLTAAKQGLPVLTANRAEFDMIQQIVPGGAFLHF